MTATRTLKISIGADVRGLIESLLVPLAATNDTDARLGISPDLATIVGTAAYGTLMGRILQPGDPYPNLGSVRAERFARAELRWRRLLHIGGDRIIGPGARIVLSGADRDRYSDLAPLGRAGFAASYSDIVEPGHAIVVEAGTPQDLGIPLPDEIPGETYRMLLGLGPSPGRHQLQTARSSETIRP